MEWFAFGATSSLRFSALLVTPLPPRAFSVPVLPPRVFSVCVLPPRFSARLLLLHHVLAGWGRPGPRSASV